MIPTLVAISIIAFALSKMVPQDPASTLVQLSTIEDESQQVLQYDSAYKKLGLDKPNFYFSILPNNYPATTNAIADYGQRQLQKKLLKLGMKNEETIKLINSDATPELVNVSIPELKNIISKDHNLQSYFYPRLHWHGTNNQYHSWISQLLAGDFGTSLVNGKDVIAQVKRALTWTMHLAIVGILMGLLAGIFFGYRLALYPEGKKEKIINYILYVLYAIPTFWLATLMVTYFTTDDYGSWTNIFPSVGMEIYPDKSTSQQIWLNGHRLFLPITLASLGSIAYLARVLRRSILDEMKAPYIMTAYSKGLSKKEVIKKHALPNALLPVITIFAGSIPASFASSVVIEVVFNIPGIGRLLFDSIQMADWNVVFCIILFIGLLTVLSYFIADILYATVDPKIRFA